MKFGDVDLPGDLVSAHADGRLVLFVGAGASVPDPSNLPKFRDLAQKIADDSHYRYSEKDLEKPEELLGRIDSGDVDVHLRVRDLIVREDSRPNELHGAIVDLAGTSSALRIVTTNYDRHMSGFLPTGVDEFEAPALPLGNDFRGLVYLHGSVRHDPSRLVVTDSDFAHAYMSDGWALGFLKRLFREFAVVFVGYGLRDTLMQYLAKALSADAQMYALTKEPEDPRWRGHGVVPVRYGSHKQLPGLIQQWADRARMGMLDHDRRIAAIVSGAPPLSPEDESYLDAAVAHPEQVGLFTRHARGAEWLRWISSRPQFKDLFDPSASFGRTEHSLKEWFANHLAANEDLAGEALALVPCNGGLVNRELWFSLVQRLSRSNQNLSEAVSGWIPVLVQTMPPGCNDWLVALLSRCVLPRDRDLALLLLDRIFEPRLDAGAAQPSGMDVVAGIADPSQIEACGEFLSSNLAGLAPDLLPILDRHLRHAHLLARRLCDGDDGWRHDGWLRQAIEDHEQNRGRGGLDLMVDAARDALEALLADSVELASGYIQAWAGHDWAILRRLAVHGWVEREDASPDAKLMWLRSVDWLGDREVWHEVMRLLAVSLPEASSDSVEATIRQVSRCCEERTTFPGQLARCKLKILGWVLSHCPDSIAAQDAFAETSRANLGFIHPAPPDFLVWHLPGDGSDRSSWSRIDNFYDIEDYHSRIEADAESLVSYLLQYKYGEVRSLDWRDALTSVRTTVMRHPDDGLAVLDALAAEREAFPGLERELGEAALSAWVGVAATASLTDEQRGRVEDLLPDVWRLGLRRWGDETATLGNAGWLESAERHWAGMIARLWLEAVEAERRIVGGARDGIPERVRAALEEILSGDSKATRLAQVVLATHLHLLFQLDEPWCRRNVLPMLDPSLDDHRAIRCWEGYLAKGRASEELLRGGLLEHLVAMAPQMDRLADRCPEARSSYAGLAASTCIDTCIDPLESGWLPGLVASADIETRVAWVHEIALRLSRLAADAADSHWSKWMRRYWADRLASVPVAMTPDEASAMAEWPVLLGGCYPEAAEIVVRSPGGLCDGSRLVDRLSSLDRLAQEEPRPDHSIEHPELTARLLAHLLRNTEIPATDSRLRHIPNVVARLDKLLDAERMEPIVNELLRLGFGELVEWLQSQRETANDSAPAASLR